MDLLRKIDTKVVRQAQDEVKRELYQSLDTILQVDRDRASGDVIAFELAWTAGDARRFFVTWRRGGELKAGEVDDGESAGGGHKASPIEKRSRLGSADIVDLARGVLEERGQKLPAYVRQTVWMCVGQSGPGAQTTVSMPGIVRKPKTS